MKRWFKPWVLVATGIVLNIVSAVLIHSVVEGNMTRAMTLEERINSVDLRVDSTWQQYLRLERREEFLLMLCLTANEGEQLETAVELVKNELRQIADQHDVPLTLEDDEMLEVANVQQFVDQVQQKLLHTVDDIYLNRLQLQRDHQRLLDANTRWRNIALFLQLMGLILVLARDLAR